MRKLMQYVERLVNEVFSNSAFLMNLQIIHRREDEFH